MKKNVGTIDKTIRIIIAILLVGLAYFYSIWWLYLVALVPLITALFSFCPLYTLIKVNTAKKK
jgi:hypothetical protein